ncbi:hypothetical protein H072_7608 [Dactylellina haptotyla CBS 200.50]|uniref:LysM domain-containing protein n=1 Tax=Dactylellina haptotyla (strain CBS 200.50) TaxID=1284197 RepID=S8BTR3_DACHA|nr:hypothetical protein H072_7608 [Dactylellina haptotyla CBS 200.50]
MKFQLSSLLVAAALAQLSVASFSYRRRATSPWPTEPDISSGCTRWVEALQGDDCNSLADVDSVPLANFLAWNPALARDCSAVKVGYGYCTASSGTTQTTSTLLTTSAPTCPTVSVTVTVTKTSAPTCPTASVTVTVTTTVTVGTTTSKPTTTISTTTTTTTKTTTTAVKIPLAPSMFPSASGTLQCVKSNTPIPQPTLITSGSTLQSVITTACNNLVTTGNKWLEIGDPYTVVLPVNGVSTTFLLNIKLGGFPVENSLCQSQLKLISSGCTTSGNTYGGCSYTSDYNLLSCIFPNV